jgi:hypothetical protein
MSTSRRHRMALASRAVDKVSDAKKMLNDRVVLRMGAHALAEPMTSARKGMA